MHIRTFKPQDSEAVIELWHSCNLIVPHNDPQKDIDRKLQVQPELFLVGEVGSELIASVMGGYEGHRGWLNYLAVSPGHRNKGYGRTMVSAVEQLLEEHGAPKINLQIRSTNSSVMAFYQALGYRVDEVVSLGKRLVID